MKQFFEYKNRAMKCVGCNRITHWMMHFSNNEIEIAIPICSECQSSLIDYLPKIMKSHLKNVKQTIDEWMRYLHFQKMKEDKQ